MFTTNEKYYQAVYVNPVAKSTITGSIVVSDSKTINLTDKDIITGSLQIDNKCVNSDSFEYGAVYQGELSVTLLLTIDRYQLYGKKVSFTVHQELADGTKQDVPLGTFNITDPQWSQKLLTIKAVDGMENFDIDIEESFFGSIYDVLSTACDKCGVQLAQTEAQLKALTNGDVQYSCYNTQVTTYRDLLAYIAKCTCTFATINRDGKLELRPYGTEVCREVPISRRKDTVIADYQTYHQGVKARFLADQNFVPYSHIETGEEGLVLDLGDIPVIYGLPSVKQAAIDAIWETLSAVRYTPASFNLLISDPALELGDMIKVKGKTAADDVTTYITSYTWAYHATMGVKGVGGNPKLAKLKNKNEVDASEIASAIASKDVVVYTYTNASKFTLNTAEKVIIRISYTTVAAATPIFIATIPVEMTSDGYLKLKYRKNDADIEGSEVYKYLAKGKHFVTILYYLSDKTDQWNKIEVVACTEYFESDNRVNAAEIAALKTYATSGTLQAAVIDTTVPTATIEKQTIKAVLFGQGLASAAEEWDGRISVVEVIPALQVGINVHPFTEAMNLAQQQPKKSTFSETMPALQVGISVQPFMDSLSFGYVIKKYTVETAKAASYTYDADAVTTDENRFSIKKTRTKASTIETIDSGSLCSVAVDLSPYETVEQVVITSD